MLAAAERTRDQCDARHHAVRSQQKPAIAVITPDEFLSVRTMAVTEAGRLSGC